MLFWTGGRPSFWMLLIPILWAVIGSAVFVLGVRGRYRINNIRLAQCFNPVVAGSEGQPCRHRQFLLTTEELQKKHSFLKIIKKGRRIVPLLSPLELGVFRVLESKLVLFLPNPGEGDVDSKLHN